MITLSAETEIAAPLQVVWDALIDLEHWAEWAPFHPGPPARIAVGEPFTVSFPLRRRIRLSGRARFVAVEPRHSLWWRSGVRGLLRIDHGFDLEPVETGTRLRHAERFSGILARPTLGILGPQQRTLYARTNEALRRRLEST